MTTPGTNGAPEDAADDDPFAYLYRPEGGEQAAEQPRGAINRPMEVGRAQYGQGAPYGQQAPYAAPQAPYGQQPYGQQPPSPYGAPSVPPQQNRYAEHSRPQPGEERPGGRGKAAVIGAVAVVTAIAVGAGIALSGNGDDKTKTAGGTHTTAPATSSAAPSPTATPSSAAWSGGTLVADASGMKLAGGAVKASQVGGAKAAGGSYVDGWSTVGASASWDVDIARPGTFQIWLRFNNSGQNANATVSVDGTPTYTPIKLNNYTAGLPPESSWYNSWVSGTVASAGHHTISVSCGQGNQCGFLLDQVAITDDGGSRPSGW